MSIRAVVAVMSGRSEKNTRETKGRVELAESAHCWSLLGSILPAETDFIYNPWHNSRNIRSTGRLVDRVAVAAASSVPWLPEAPRRTQNCKFEDPVCTLNRGIRPRMAGIHGRWRV